MRANITHIMDNIFYYRLAISILSTGGFFLAYYIRNSKLKNAPLVCPIGGACDNVVNSNYSKLLGFHVEDLGMIYYAGVSLLYFPLALGIIEIGSEYLGFIILFTFFAFLFSIYLTSVQAFYLREWCTWCLISAFLCTLIFIFSVMSHNVFPLGIFLMS